MIDLGTATDRMQNENGLDVDLDDVINALPLFNIVPKKFEAASDDEMVDESESTITEMQFATLAEYFEYQENED